MESLQYLSGICVLLVLHYAVVRSLQNDMENFKCLFAPEEALEHA
jgi:hypothetical protein